MATQHSVAIDYTKLISIIGRVEWFVSSGRITYDEAIVLIHAAVDEAFRTKPYVDRVLVTCFTPAF